jgi:hypothetical protein
MSSVGDWDSINQKLSQCKVNTIRWQQQKRGPLRTTINSLQAKLNLLQGEEGHLGGSEVKMVKKDLQLLLDQEDLRWRQHANTD